MVSPVLRGVLRVALEKLEVRSCRNRHGWIEEENEGMGCVMHRPIRKGEPSIADDKDAIATEKKREKAYVPVYAREGSSRSYTESYRYYV